MTPEQQQAVDKLLVELAGLAEALHVSGCTREDISVDLYHVVQGEASASGLPKAIERLLADFSYSERITDHMEKISLISIELERLTGGAMA